MIGFKIKDYGVGTVVIYLLIPAIASYFYLHKNQNTELCILDSLLLEPSLAGVSVIDILYIPNSPHSVFTWFMSLGKLCVATNAPEFKLRLICA